MKGLPRKKEEPKREFTSPPWVQRRRIREGLGNAGLEGDATLSVGLAASRDLKESGLTAFTRF